MYTRPQSQGNAKILIKQNQAPQKETEQIAQTEPQQSPEATATPPVQAQSEEVQKEDTLPEKEAQRQKKPRPRYKARRPEKKPEPTAAELLSPTKHTFSYTSDELLIFALIILLIMQGSDDVLVLALCYIVL